MPNFRIEENQIRYDYETEDGGRGIHAIPLEALGVRMALLNLTDPGQALDIILDEQLLEDENPYEPVYAALAQGESHPIAAFRKALDIMPISNKCDGRHEAEFKSELNQKYTEYLESVKNQFIQESMKPL